MDKDERLLEHLDEIDRHIATAGMTLFIVALSFIALLLNVSTDLSLPGFDLKLQKAHALVIGCPVILILFQYITIAVFGMVRIEESLSSSTEINAMDPTLRTPTVFSMIFLAHQTAEALRSRTLMLWHVAVVFGCFFLVPVLTCAAMSYWLVKNARWFLAGVGLVCALGCVVEIAFVAVASWQRFASITKPNHVMEHKTLDNRP